MAVFELKAGKKADMLNQEELKHHLDQQTVSWFQEMARGMSTARFGAFVTPSQGMVLIPGPGGSPIGPEVGFCWAVQRITAHGLGENDVLTVYRNSPTPTNMLGVITAARSLHPGSKGAILRGDERLYILGSGLVSTDEISVNGESLEVGESDLYKLL